MIQLCHWFDAYRDGELSPAEREQFETHRRTCRQCRQREDLLNRMIHTLKIEPPASPLSLPTYVEQRIRESEESWESILVSWWRPVVAFTAVLLLLIGGTSSWLFTTGQPVVDYSEYENLIFGNDTSVSADNTPQMQSVDDLITWVEQGGNNP